MPDIIPTPAQLAATGAGIRRAFVELEAEIRYFIYRHPEWKRAAANREAQWHREHQKAILRQLLNRDTSPSGRKRRARRARGRWIEGGWQRIEGGWQRIEGGSTPSMLRDEVNSIWLDPSVGKAWKEKAND
jgi:hypothetical protein